jgi:hypothetical protein
LPNTNSTLCSSALVLPVLPQYGYMLMLATVVALITLATGRRVACGTVFYGDMIENGEIHGFWTFGVAEVAALLRDTSIKRLVVSQHQEAAVQASQAGMVVTSLGERIAVASTRDLRASKGWATDRCLPVLSPRRRPRPSRTSRTASKW